MRGDFSYQEYAEIVSGLCEGGYKFCGYHELVEEAPFCTVRHDIDLLPKLALALGAIEKERQVKSTFCFMVRSSAYNIFSIENARVVDSILSQGHWLGLHFDCGAYASNFSVEELAEAGRMEVSLLEKVFGTDVKVISYHKPSNLVLGGTREVSDPLPHVYMSRFIRRMAYFSDSYGEWRYGHPLDSEAFKEKKALNLCMHPVWWSEKSRSPLVALNEVAMTKKSELRDYMLTNIVGV